MREDYWEYLQVRKRYLFEHPRCEVGVKCVEHAGRRGISTQVHHRRGRIGDLLLNTKYFTAACDRCHDHIHRYPLWAKEHGFMEDRNQ